MGTVTWHFQSALQSYKNSKSTTGYSFAHWSPGKNEWLQIIVTV